MTTYDKVNKDLERKLDYRFWQKREERPRHADQLSVVADRPRLDFCPMRHRTLAYAGPPHAPLPRRYVCLDCKETASEAELRDRGEDFWEARDWIIHEIMDSRLQQRAKSPGRKLLFTARS